MIWRGVRPNTSRTAREMASSGTVPVPEEAISRAVREVFGLTPRQIIEGLDLLRPIYQATASYGHFGREEKAFTWERTDKKGALQAAAGGRARRR